MHVLDYDLQSATDGEIFERAQSEHRAILSADTDFGTLLAQRCGRKPSVILFRGQLGRRPERQAALLLANLSAIEEALDRGSIAVFDLKKREFEFGRYRSGAKSSRADAGRSYCARNPPSTASVWPVTSAEARVAR